jgi:hypothetical protein
MLRLRSVIETFEGGVRFTSNPRVGNQTRLNLPTKLDAEIVVIRFDGMRQDRVEVPCRSRRIPDSFGRSGEGIMERPDLLRAFRAVAPEHGGPVGRLAATEVAAILRSGEARHRVGEEVGHGLGDPSLALVSISQRSAVDSCAIGRQGDPQLHRAIRGSLEVVSPDGAVHREIDGEGPGVELLAPPAPFGADLQVRLGVAGDDQGQPQARATCK